MAQVRKLKGQKDAKPDAWGDDHPPMNSKIAGCAQKMYARSYSKPLARIPIKSTPWLEPSCLRRLMEVVSNASPSKNQTHPREKRLH